MSEFNLDLLLGIPGVQQFLDAPTPPPPRYAWAQAVGALKGQAERYVSGDGPSYVAEDVLVYLRQPDHYIVNEYFAAFLSTSEADFLGHNPNRLLPKDLRPPIPIVLYSPPIVETAKEISQPPRLVFLRSVQFPQPKYVDHLSNIIHYVSKVLEVEKMDPLPPYPKQLASF